MATATALADSYMKYRKEGKVDELLKMVSDDIVMESSRDGTFKGTEEFSKYLNKVAFSGDWPEPAKAEGDDKAVVHGSVKIAFFPVSVKAHFEVKDGKIHHIKIGRS